MNGIYNPSQEQESRIPTPIERRLYATETAEQLLSLLVEKYDRKFPSEAAQQLAVNQSVELKVQVSQDSQTDQSQQSHPDLKPQAQLQMSQEELLSDAREKLRGLTT